MTTKYIRAHSGFFALFSEGVGAEHGRMADHIDDVRSTSDAGFVHIDDGTFTVYGNSVALGISADQSAAEDMNKALEAGELRLYPYGEFNYIATNAHLPGNYTVVRDIEELRKARIFSR